MLESLSSFIDKSHPVTLGVLFILSLYFIVVNWVFLYRWMSLNQWIATESEALETLLMGSVRLDERSFLTHFISPGKALSKPAMDMAQYACTKEATKGLTVLSIVASTTPFIGLFGTVVSILETFKHIGGVEGTMGVVAMGVSDALVATASGIFVAIFAYTYHQILKRQSFELVGLVRMQSDALLSKEQ